MSEKVYLTLGQVKAMDLPDDTPIVLRSHHAFDYTDARTCEAIEARDEGDGDWLDREDPSPSPLKVVILID